MTTQETTERAYPTTQERIEIEDDLRCGECGSTEAGNCFYCKAD